MSLRSIIATALRSVFRFVIVSTEVVIAGIRTIITSLVPARNMEAAEMAEAFIAEDLSPVGPPAGAAAPTPTQTSRLRLSEAERVRKAALELLAGRRIPDYLLDPERAAEMEILKWLADRDELQLGYFRHAPEKAIAAHLDGKKSMRMPLLPAAEAREEELREALRPPSVAQWVKILTQEAADDGNDDPDFDQLLERAQALADAGCTLADFKTQSVEDVHSEERIIDDLEDVG